ncbi:hypothetical protein K432DRAFT_383188 [Lepidopterella palustris CBS 459.81]|uniref:Translation machinery-associated protein 16 n=1 Tax=Lepidopterella palustris CBS 459.81 TaxID=1314670 RepID=A0A8E2JER2_9PEZI|nr:hypothetical protein K432DRAFT_383188 [Lepidopterella palustris CBS 459.81]
MPARSLNKVSKQIAKKKGRNVILHENSRDTRRLQRASCRDDKLSRLVALRKKEHRFHLERISYFRTAASERLTPFTIPEIQNLIETYLHRDDEELAKEKAERRPGRPASNRENLLKQKQSLEEREYISGFWMPDLEDVKNLEFLKEWTGEWVSLSTMKFVRISKTGVKHESSFPPKGQS